MSCLLCLLIIKSPLGIAYYICILCERVNSVLLGAALNSLGFQSTVTCDGNFHTQCICMCAFCMNLRKTFAQIILAPYTLYSDSVSERIISCSNIKADFEAYRGSILYSLSGVLHSILCSHLLLRLREAFTSVTAHTFPQAASALSQGLLESTPTEMPITTDRSSRSIEPCDLPR